MGQGRALLFGLLVCLLAGCATGKPTRFISWLGHAPFQGPTGPDVIRMDVALIERPADDAYLSWEVWRLADEQVVSLERRAILEESGFRVGLLSGLKPAGLQTLLSSETSCANPRRFFLHAGKAATLALGPARARCRFQLPQEGQSGFVSFEQATSFLDVVPSLSGGGQIRLRFTPQIQHGEPMLAAHAAEDNSGFMLQSERPTKSYAALAWEVALAPNQYLIVGARLDRRESLGYQSFLRQDEAVAVQRLLVIRAAHASPAGSEGDSLDSEENEARLGRTPPLVLQASWTTARGSAN